MTRDSTVGQPRFRMDKRLQLWLREVYFARLATQHDLAKFLGCSQTTVCRIVSAR